MSGATGAVDLALALSGVVVSTTRSRDQASDVTFSGMVDLSLVRPGSLEFEAFALRGPPERPVFFRLAQIDGEARGRQIVESASRVVLRQGGDFGFDALQRAVNFGRVRKRRDLSLVADNQNPMLFFETSPGRSTKIVVEIELTVPTNTEVQIWFQTEDSPNFIKEQLRRALVESGRNREVLEIETDSVILPSLRIDPGVGPGAYVIHSLTVLVP